MDREHTCCFTGHRPNKLPWGADESDPRCAAVFAQLTAALDRAYEAGCRHFICGMARGGDLLFCRAALDLRDRRPGVTVEGSIPCQSQADRWPAAEQARRAELLDRCDFETMVQHHYDWNCMMRRNRYMVDRSCRIIALYDGIPSGGTASTLAYALKHDLTTDIIRPE
ncbi:MAG: DUF1273 domain-containing protein [Ruminococcaceae bacterium]|nr:DUF1273 domain-containing protein [Oscillospiraceae bacterium]